MVNHSALPWRVHPKASLAIESAKGDVVASFGTGSQISDEWASNAIFVTIAVNERQPMIDALKKEGYLVCECGLGHGAEHPLLYKAEAK